MVFSILNDHKTLTHTRIYSVKFVLKLYNLSLVKDTEIYAYRYAAYLVPNLSLTIFLSETTNMCGTVSFERKDCPFINRETLLLLCFFAFFFFFREVALLK